MNRQHGYYGGNHSYNYRGGEHNGHRGGGGHRKNDRSYSQRKRDKMDYRQAYFAHNPGLFGVIWFCAYCHKPIIGRHNVQVDHIMPLNNPLGQNARYNLVAACPECNRAKSDKVDGRVVKGYFSKVIEVIVFSVQKIFLVGVVGAWTALAYVGNFAKGIILAPFTNTSFITKIIALIIYALIIYFVVASF